MSDDIPTQRERIERKLDDIERGSWTVVEYDPEIDPYDAAAVTLRIEYDGDDEPTIDTGTSEDQRERIAGIKSIIREVDADHPSEPGAPLATIIDRAKHDLDLDEEAVADELDHLRTLGEIYSPSGDQYKVV